MSHGVGESGSPTPKEAPQDAALQRLEQRALSRAGVAEQFQLDPWLRCLSGSQLLDVVAFVVVLGERSERKLKEAISGHGSRFTHVVVKDNLVGTV